mmetsp:Transcript_30145/g.89717  ORF Transcript_30145/g.89717 Transcript_30145/m.89717 type:complete len:323 (-) Transcript_30145:165-1133(-)
MPWIIRLVIVRKHPRKYTPGCEQVTALLFRPWHAHGLPYYNRFDGTTCPKPGRPAHDETVNVLVRPSFHTSRPELGSKVFEEVLNEHVPQRQTDEHHASRGVLRIPSLVRLDGVLDFVLEPRKDSVPAFHETGGQAPIVRVREHGLVRLVPQRNEHVDESFQKEAAGRQGFVHHGNGVESLVGPRHAIVVLVGDRAELEAVNPTRRVGQHALQVVPNGPSDVELGQRPAVEPRPSPEARSREGGDDEYGDKVIRRPSRRIVEFVVARPLLLVMLHILDRKILVEILVSGSFDRVFTARSAASAGSCRRFGGRADSVVAIDTR